MSDTYYVENPFSDNPKFTPVEAFFLGGIIMSIDEQEDDDDEIISLVRYNKRPGAENYYKHHYKAISNLAHRAGGSIRQCNERGKLGFAAVFNRGDFTIDSLIEAAESLRHNGGIIEKEAFLAGAMDGRSYLDKAKKYLVIDCHPTYIGEVFELIKAFGDDLGIEIKLNNSYRPRAEESGQPRKPQIRMNANAAKTFFERIGLVSPKNIEGAVAIYGFQYQAEKLPAALPGVKVLSNNDSRILFQNALRENAPTLEFQMDIALEEEHYAKVLVEHRGVPTHNGEPKPVPEESVCDSGRITYRRSQAVKLNAYENSGCCCEANHDHMTFNRRSDARPYLEMHHLVPMALQPFFNVSLDIEENVVALCSNCHSEVHYGEKQADLVRRLLALRADDLKRVGIVISEDDLVEAYCCNYAGL